MDQKQQRSFKERGGQWVLAQAGLLLAAVLSGWLWHGQWQSKITTAAGLLLVILSALTGIAGATALGRQLTPFPRPASQADLIQTGIYHFIRHPLYTSVSSITFGWALLRASAPALGVALALAWFFDAKARREEHWLRRQFPDYADYAQRVCRFIPWLY